MKHIDVDASEADYYVPLLTLSPRSEAGVIPLKAVRGGGAVQHVEPPAAHPPVDLAPILMRLQAVENRPEPLPAAQPPTLLPDEIAALPARVAGLEQRLVEMATERESEDGPGDLPAFLRRAGATTAPANLAAIEQRLMATEARLSQALDQLGRPSPPPLPTSVALPNHIATVDDIKAITDRIAALEARVAEMEQAAREVLAELTKPRQQAAETVSGPPETIALPPLPQYKALAAQAIRDAGRRRRDASAGGSADDRDSIRRLSVLAQDVKASRTRALELIHTLSRVRGEKLDDLANALIEASDRVDDVLIATLELEYGAVTDIADAASHADVDRIRKQIIDAIGNC